MFCEYVCSHRRPTCNAQAPYCRLWRVRLYNFFLTLSHIRHDFRKKYIEHKICVFYFLHNFCLEHFSFYAESSLMLSYVCIGFRVQCPLLLSDCNWIWIFTTDFRKILKCHISWESVQSEPSCSLRTDMTMLIAVLQVHLKTVHTARTVFMCFVFTCVSE